MAQDNAQCTIHNAQRRYIDVDKFAEKICNFQQIDEDTANKMIFLLRTFPTADVEEVKHGEWIYKHRHRGGFERKTVCDVFGNPHTVTIDNRYECAEPYCSVCGKLGGDFLNYCGNCGAKMRGDTE